MATNPSMPQTIDETFARREELLDEWVEIGREIAALEARRSAVLADRLDLMVHEHRSVLPGPNEMSFRSMTAEFAAAGHLPQATVEARITDAWVLVRCFPATHAALAAGRINSQHASVIISEAPNLSGVENAESTTAEYETQVLPFAENDTAARTRVRARGVTAQLCPQSLADQHRKSRAERTVSVRSVGDGLAMLTAILPEVLAYAIYDRATSIAREVVQARPAGQRRVMTAARRVREAAEAAARAAQEPFDPEPPSNPGSFSSEDAPWMTGSSTSQAGPTGEDQGCSPDESEERVAEHDLIAPDDVLAEGAPLSEQSDAVPMDYEYGAADSDTRSMDQLRADIIADLLLTTDPSTVTSTALESIRATVNITVAAQTVAGYDDRLSELEGHGPQLSDVSRILAGHSPSWNRLFLDPKGMVVETDNYVPTAEMKRYLRARDQHCRFPGCRAPVHRCQIDHNHDHAKGGKTANDNLSLFCTSHHPLKHPDVAERDRWTARQLENGDILWTSPLGRSYTDGPPLRVMFV